MLLASSTAAVHGQSALDGFDPNVGNAEVNAVVVQPDGKILVGGYFGTLSPNGGGAIARNNMARLNPDGTVDPVFDPNASDSVWSIAVQSNGKIVVAGDFDLIGGRARYRIARLDPTTGLADSFNPLPNNHVYPITVQADGKVLIGGPFTTIGGVPRNFMARLDATGGFADSFNPNSTGVVNAIAVQADGKILAGGWFTGANSIGGQTRNRIARLDPTTAMADSFNPDANNVLFAIAVQADGKILAGGQFTNIGGQARNRIARLDPATGLADSFNPNANSEVDAIVVQADGKILVRGTFSNIGGQVRDRIARLDPTTGLADSFNANANSAIWAIGVQADGKVVVGGFFTNLNGQPRNRIARLETDGRLDRTLNLNMVGSVGEFGYVSATANQPDGKILLGGDFSTVLGVPRSNITRLNTDGTLDTAFVPNANNVVESIAPQADGKVLVGGQFTSIGGQTRNRIARLDPTTGLADAFNPNASDPVFSMAVQADGKILVSGGFSSIGGQPRNSIARLDPTTGLADSFNPNSNGEIIPIAVQADGRILVGSQFTSIGGQARNRIARLDPTTGLADSFDPNANGDVLSIATHADGKIVVSGDFTNIGGQMRSRVARLDAETGLADSFNPNANQSPRSLAVQADGKILAGGAFITIGGQTRRYIARLDGTTGMADSFDPNASDNVFSVAVRADGKILVGGDFISIGGQRRGFFARLNNDTTAMQDLDVTQTSITWTLGGSSPQFTRVTFESSTDGVNYTPLGHGTPAGPNWILTGLSLVTGQNYYIRARGSYRSGYFNGSESIMASVRNAFFAGPTPTPSPTPTATATVPPSPTPTATPTATATATEPPTPTPPTPMPPAQALNISTRMRVQTGDNVGIGGFIISSGPSGAPKRVILRAIGPSLTASGLPDALADPVLELHGPAGVTTIINDNWKDTQEAEIRATGIPPSNDLESAIVATLAPGNYTAIVKGNKNTSGVALVEVYDLNQAVPAKLANISTRAFVSTDNNVVIAGFILGNNPGDDDVILRGIGPSLTAAGVPNALANPTLELRNSNGSLLWANNDWQDDPAQAAMVSTAGLAPTNALESAIAATLSPGQYTVLLAGRNSGTGVGLVEVYDRGRENGGSPSPTPTGTPTPTATATAAPTPTLTPTPSPTPCSGTVFPENFDGVTTPALPSGWVGTNVGGDGVMWVTSTKTPDTAPNDAFLPDQNGISDKYLDTSATDVISSSAVLRFRNNFDMEFSDGTYWDGCVLEVSSPNINGGAFTDVTDSAVGGSFVTGGYVGVISGLASNPLAGRMAWSGSSGGYIDTMVNLGPNVSGQMIKLRFRMGTDEAVAAAGWQVDTITMVGAACASPTPTPDGTPTATPTATATATATPIRTPTPTPPITPTATPTPVPTPPPECVLNEDFDHITTLPWAGWVQTNHSTTAGTTGWFQGNAAVFPAQSGAATFYIAANFNSNRDASTVGTFLLTPPLTMQPDTPPSPTPTPPNTINNWLLTPPLTLQNGAMMTFYTRTVDVPQFPDRLQVRMSTAGASTNVGTGPFDVGDFATLMLEINPNQTTTGYPNVWTQFAVTVNGLPSPTTGRIAFRYFVFNGGPNEPNGDYVGIDTLRFFCTTPTPTPTPPPSPTPSSAPGRASAGRSAATPSPTPTTARTPTPDASGIGDQPRDSDAHPERGGP